MGPTHCPLPPSISPGSVFFSPGPPRWIPPPLGSGPRRRGGAGQRPREDLVFHLVQLAGSREAIVQEYRARLAERLLRRGCLSHADVDADLDTDLRTVELLKVGPTPLSHPIPPGFPLVSS